MRIKTIITLFLLVVLGSILTLGSTTSTFAPIEGRKDIEEQLEKKHHISEEPKVSGTISHDQPFNADTTSLNAIISDFQVNDNTGPNGAWQQNPSISIGGNGNFVIVWVDIRNGVDDIYAQRYSSDSTPIGTNFKVNNDQESTRQWSPSISLGDTGNFVITWKDEGKDYGICAQRYSSDGTAIGSNFKVDDHPEGGNSLYPSISTGRIGDFVITWAHTRDYGIYAQRYSHDGTALGTNFKVNNDPESGYSLFPSISTDSSGNFAITWVEERNINKGDIYVKRYSSDGTELGKSLKVNDDQDVARQAKPSISVNDGGNFVITWLDTRNGNNDIYAQRYSSDGASLGMNFKVNDNQECTWCNSPSISIDDTSNFVITWDGDTDVLAQRYSSDGSARGTNFKVNDDQGSTTQMNPSICLARKGDFVIAWEDYRNGDYDIYLQRYGDTGSLLGNNFKVNDDRGSARQKDSSISFDGIGGFVMTWLDERNGDADIYAQRYSVDGTMLGTNFIVNDDDAQVCQSHPSISSDSIGNFIITWHDRRSGGDIYAQRYSSDGTRFGKNFRVNDQGYWWQEFPSIATDTNGNFVITWMDNMRYGNQYYDIYAQRYSSEGAKLGNNFQVNNDQEPIRLLYPSIFTYGQGDFMITWKNSSDLYAQRYSSDGTALGTNFKVNINHGSSVSHYLANSTDSSGNFVMAWVDDRDVGYDIYAQRYFNDGSLLGTNFRVSEQGSASQYIPSLGMDGSGNFIIMWMDSRNNRDLDVYGQRYSSDGIALGGNFRVTNTSNKHQVFPDVKLWNNRIYSTWEDNRAGNSGYDIWANVLDWDNPLGLVGEELDQVPTAFILSQNYPNPFNPSTTIAFAVTKAGEVNLAIYNLSGQQIQTLYSGKIAAGNHKVMWNGTDHYGVKVSSGIYIYQLRGMNFTTSKKLVLMK